MKKLYGVTVAMVTPMTADQQPDYSAVADLTEKLVNRGVNCLYPCGTTGEMLKLTLEDRKQVAETVVKTAAGRVRVFIHVMRLIHWHWRSMRVASARMALAL